MARPDKARRVCKLPACRAFCPASLSSEETPEKGVQILLTVEEYEALRLIDYNGNNQQQAAAQMGVSRATVQALYTQARKKLARFIVEGASLKIDGGSYTLCGHTNCVKFNINKGDKKMKIAVTYENGEVFQHFGHTQQFKVYTAENGKVTSSEVVNVEGEGHGALAGFLKGKGVDTLICGGIGGGARNALAEAGIQLYPGASGSADAQVQSFLNGSLQYDPDTMCSHHSHEEGHTCGDHACGG